MPDISGLMTTGSEVVGKAGSGYTTAYDGFLGSAFKHAEGLIDTLTRFDFSSAIGSDTVTSGGRALLSDTCSALVANAAIEFDMNSYPNLILAEDMININRDTYLRNLSILRDDKVQRFIASGAGG